MTHLLTRPHAILLICVVLYCLVAGLLSHPRGFWSLDSAVRLVQVESFVRQGYQELAVRYPAEQLDPEGRFFPATDWFHAQRDGKHYLLYLPYFSAVSAPLYGLLGFPGLLVLPLVAGLFTVWLTLRVVQERAPGFAGPAGLAVGIGTPLFIYSAAFWDHAPAVALATAALGIVLREVDLERPSGPAPMVFAGTLLGAGLWLRNEAYLLAVVTVLMWLVVAPRYRGRGAAALSLGVIAAALPLWLINVRLFGAVLGPKGQQIVSERTGAALSAATSLHAFWSWVLHKAGNAYYQLVSPDFYAFDLPHVLWGLIAAGVILAVPAIIRAGVQRRSAQWLNAAAVLAVGIVLVSLSGRKMVSGLIPAAPFVVLALLSTPDRRSGRFLWGVVCAFSALVIVTASRGGVQWGPRYLMPIVPALTWLAADAMERARMRWADVFPAVRNVAALLVGLSILVQMAGVDQVHQLARSNALVKRVLRSITADIVITPLEWLVLEAGEVYFEKQLMLVRNQDELRALVGRLAERRVDRWAYIPQSGPLFSPQRVEEWTKEEGWHFRAADDDTRAGLRLVTFEGFALTSTPPRKARPSP